MKDLIGAIGTVMFLGGLAYCSYPVGIVILKWFFTPAPEPGVLGEGIHFFDVVGAGIAEAIGRPGYGGGIAILVVGWCLVVWYIVTDSNKDDDSVN